MFTKFQWSASKLSMMYRPIHSIPLELSNVHFNIFDYFGRFKSQLQPTLFLRQKKCSNN